MLECRWLLEILAPDGELARTVELLDVEMDVDRSKGTLRFPDDLEMSDRHALPKLRTS